MVGTGGAGCHWGWAVLGCAGIPAHPGLCGGFRVRGNGRKGDSDDYAGRAGAARCRPKHSPSLRVTQARSSRRAGGATRRWTESGRMVLNFFLGYTKRSSESRAMGKAADTEPSPSQWVKLPNTQARSLALASLRLADAAAAVTAWAIALSRPGPAGGRAGPPVLGLGAAGGRRCMLPSRSSFKLF